MQPTQTVTIEKIRNSKRFVTEDILIREVPLEIVAENKRVGFIMATPVDAKALAVGYLLSEGLLDSHKAIRSIALENDGTRVVVHAKINAQRQQHLATDGVIVSGCGRSTTATLDPDTLAQSQIQSSYSISSAYLMDQMGQFYTECPLYEATGCVHTAKLVLSEGRSFLAEDIAQHNTIDKVAGKAALAGADLSYSLLMVSGRLSAEMVAKAVVHRIPILASRTATTAYGFRIAEMFGLTLVGFVRGCSLNLYTHARRIYD